MLDFTEEELRHAFETACASATGMLSVLDDGSELKPYNVAKTALLALTSIQLAKAGFRGNPDALGSYRGYLKMMTGKEDTELKPFLLKGSWAIMKTYTKPYASCRYTHPAVEAAIHLRGKVRPGDVERIDIKTYSLAVSGHDHTEIPGSYSAKMSIPYATAAGLIYGKAGLQEFSEEKVRDPEILALTRKIRVEADQDLSDAFPGIQAAFVVSGLCYRLSAFRRFIRPGHFRRSSRSPCCALNMCMSSSPGSLPAAKRRFMEAAAWHIMRIMMNG